MKHLTYTVPSDYEARRACMLTYGGIDICKLVECANVYEGDKAYIFVPDYGGVDRALEAGMYDIPGLALELRLPQFTYVHWFPAFLTFRYIPLDRPDWQWHYATVDLQDNQDQWEYMVRKEGLCAEDPIRVRRCDL